MPGFLDDYQPVEERLEQFWADHPEGRIITEMLPAPEGQWIVKASVWRVSIWKIEREGEQSADVYLHLPHSTGLAQEHVTEKGVNSTSALENCETSAIGRALANLGYAAKGKRPSREEMAKTKAGGEPSQAKHVVWLAEQVKIFKAWSDEGKREAYSTAMNYLGFEEMDTMDKAKSVFANMTAQYEQPESLLGGEG